MEVSIVPQQVLVTASSGAGAEKETTTPTAAGGSGAQATATKPAGGQSGASSGELGAVIENFAKVKSFRAKLTIESPGQPKQEATMEIVLPDKFHMTFSGGGGARARRRG